MDALLCSLLEIAIGIMVALLMLTIWVWIDDEKRRQMLYGLYEDEQGPYRYLERKLEANEKIASDEVGEPDTKVPATMVKGSGLQVRQADDDPLADD